MNKMPYYNQCSMKKWEHILMYFLFGILISGIVYLFYHIVPVSVVIGFLTAVYVEKMYAESTVKKRKKTLRLQFKDFLGSMSVAVRAGNVEIYAVKSALDDLRLSYSSKADIVLEVENMILQYEKGGIPLKELFEDFADRSELEDIHSFAAVYSVIEGKSDRFGDILTQTEEIIRDKIEIEQEIETTITSAKSETMVMLIMPIVIVVAMSGMGSGLLDSLFTTAAGHLSATVSLIIFAVSYILAVKSSDIEV